MGRCHTCLLTIGLTTLLASSPATSEEILSVSDIDGYLKRTLNDWQVPGIAVAIVRSDRVVFSQGLGVRETGTENPVDENTLFAIASNTKAFTAAALSMLVEEGKVKWDDPVTQYLPYFALYDRYVTEDIRIRDLLCHRSGLGQFSGDLLWYGTSYSPKQILSRVEHLPQSGRFGRSYNYNNLMFLAAGEVIVKVSGMSWSEFIQTRILDPLDMNRTVTSTCRLAAAANVAVPHKTKSTGNVALPWYNWDNAAAVGGIISSTADMTKWVQLQLRKGSTEKGDRLFSEGSSQEMWRPHTLIKISDKNRKRYPSTHFMAYGLGWGMRDYKGHKILSHGGGYDGMYSRVVLVPEKDLGIVVLTNSMTSLPSVVCKHLLDEVLGGEKTDWSKLMLEDFKKDRAKYDKRMLESVTPRLENTKPSLKLEQYVGTYRDVMFGDTTLEVVDEKLVLSFAINKDLVADLSHMHRDTFAIQWRREFAWFGNGNLQFRLNNKTNVTGFELDVPNEDLWFYEMHFKRVPSIRPIGLLQE
ncbi:MAG: serine hydrolase [Pirellulaceae bacterium]